MATVLELQQKATKQLLPLAPLVQLFGIINTTSIQGHWNWCKYYWYRFSAQVEVAKSDSFIFILRAYSLHLLTWLDFFFFFSIPPWLVKYNFLCWYCKFYCSWIASKNPFGKLTSVWEDRSIVLVLYNQEANK